MRSWDCLAFTGKRLVHRGYFDFPRQAETTSRSSRPQRIFDLLAVQRYHAALLECGNDGRDVARRDLAAQMRCKPALQPIDPGGTVLRLFTQPLDDLVDQLFPRLRRTRFG